MENGSTETSFGPRKSKTIRDGKYKSAKRQFSTSGIDFSANYYGASNSLLTFKQSEMAF